VKVLLVEDDIQLGESLKEYLEGEGFEVGWVVGSEELAGVEVIAGFDVVVLDLILGHESGEELLEEMRKKGIDTPVLVLTAKRTLKDKEVCFGLGADDYLTKPFEPRELVLRLKALVRRASPGDVVRVGDAEIDLSGRTVRRKGKEFRLSKTAWELLTLLLRHRGKVVSTSVILGSIWGQKPVGDEIVRAYIKELRKVLPKDSIETYKGVGYRLR